MISLKGLGTMWRKMKVDEWGNGDGVGTGFIQLPRTMTFFFSLVLADQADKPNDKIHVSLTCLSASLAVLRKNRKCQRESSQ